MPAREIGFGESPRTEHEQTGRTGRDALAATLAGLGENRLIRGPRRTKWRGGLARAATEQKGPAGTVHFSSFLFYALQLFHIVILTATGRQCVQFLIVHLYEGTIGG
jgi:hypothetical protein